MKTTVNTVIKRVVSRACYWASISIIISGCAGTTQLTSQLKTAKHERDVLRDAYEAQQLRLRELELRLLKLEDHKTIDAREVTDDSKRYGADGSYHADQSRPQTLKSGESSQAYMKNRTASREQSRSSEWRDRRLRALPVVRVSASQALSASGDLIERESQRRDLAEKAERLERTERTARRKRRYTRSTSRSSGDRHAKSREEIPTLRTSQDRSQNESRPRRSHHKSARERAHHSSHKPHQDMSHPHHQTHVVKKHTHDNSSTKSQATANAPTVDQVELYQRQIASSASSSERAPILLQLATELRRRGQRGQAMRLMRRLISESPTHQVVPDALYLMGRLQIERGEEAKGRATLLRLSRLYPNAQAAQSARKFLRGVAQ
jgi:TolA-binding protein